MDWLTTMNRLQRLVILTAALVGSAILLMLFYWIITSSLESWGTVLSGVFLCLLLASLLWLARGGRERLAAALLTALLWLLNLALAAGYGLGTPSIAGFILPILLSRFGFGASLGYGITALSVAAVWGIGAAAAAGWYQPWIPFQESDLTFTAPMYTFLFTLTILMVSSYIQKQKGETQ